MRAKENFSKAMFDMFGVGSDRNDAAKEEVVATMAVEPAEVVESAVEWPEENTVVENKAYVYQKPAPAAPATGHTYLAPDTQLEGTLRTTSNVEIAGTFRGDIISEGDVTLHTSVTGNITARSVVLLGCVLTGECVATEKVTVCSDSAVQGNVTTKDVLCSGQITGDVKASGNVKLESAARVKGNIAAVSLSVENGATIEGKLTIA